MECRRVGGLGGWRRGVGAGESGAQQAHGIDQELAQDGQGFRGEGAAAAGEPDVHGGFAAGDDGAGQGAEVQFVEFDAAPR